MSECTNGESSETACEFVVEFADIITTQKFNSSQIQMKVDGEIQNCVHM